MDLKEIKTQAALYAYAFSRVVALSVAVGFLTRVVLWFTGEAEQAFSIGDGLRIFLLGAVNDVCVAVVASFFLWLILIFFSEGKYRKPWGYIIEGILVAALGYVWFCHTVFDDYGSAAPRIARYFLMYKAVSFGLRLFVPSVREKWRAAEYYLLFFLYVSCILLNAVSEYFFWEEFGVRYNFIAVDYLIYTGEVVGNIFESYPMIPMLAGLVAVALALTWWLLRKHRLVLGRLPGLGAKAAATGAYALLVAGACWLLSFNLRFQQTENVYVNELQANGLHRFYLAFSDNKLEYDAFYPTLPADEVMASIHREYNSTGNNRQTVRDSLPEMRRNIVLITVESLSASFLAHGGEPTGRLTPFIDSLMNESLAFSNLYATGNRTVRGLEAVTLCLPPSPGESIIKQPANANLFSTGKVLKEKGYTVRFLYGGDSYFDNMKTFFSGNGYEVVDRKAFAADEVTFANIWGACDEDIYRKAIRVFNDDARSGKPFFGHIMTVSNHRPFTYPAGKIAIPSNAKSREGGVMYTDYALRQFMEMARKQPWFGNTVFVITADHCASSAGKTEIPLDKYHIPALVYAPGFIAPQTVGTLASQIDLMPTLFGLLHFSYDSRFYGKDLFAPGYRPRAFVATYQSLGYWEDSTLTVLSPVRKVKQFRVKEGNQGMPEQIRLDTADSAAIRQAIVHYQVTGHIRE